MIWCIFLVPYLATNFVASSQCKDANGGRTYIKDGDISAAKFVPCLPQTIGRLLFIFAIFFSYITTVVWPLYQTVMRGKVMLLGSAPALPYPNLKALKNLKSLLADPRGSDYFKTFLVQEFSVENILFFNEVSHYQGIDDEEELYSQAHSIYKQYLEINKAPLEVNLPAGIAKDIANTIHWRTKVVNLSNDSSAGSSHECWM